MKATHHVYAANQDKSEFYDLPTKEVKIEPESDVEIDEENEDVNSNLCGSSARIVFVDEIVKEEPVFYDPSKKQTLSTLDLKGYSNRNIFDIKPELVEEEVKYHIEIIKKSFECYICKFETKTAGSMRSHFLVHSAERPLNHKQHTTQNKEHRCMFCSRRFCSAERLQYHKQIHTNEKPFSCSVCQKTFNRQDSLKVHCRLHTGEKPYKCNKCQMSFRLRQQLTYHGKVHSTQNFIKRPEARAVTGKNADRAMVQPTIAIESIPEKHLFEYRSYECYLCHFGGNRPEVAMHMRIVHTDRQIFQCKICSKQFLRKESIAHHMTTAIHSTKRDFKCDKCGRSFARKDGLRLHLQTHSKVLLQCQLCPKKLTLKSSLRNHMRIHTNVKPHECKFCGKRFTKVGHMKRHILTHTGDRPFPCSYCPMAYTRKYLLTEHTQKLHKMI